MSLRNTDIYKDLNDFMKNIGKEDESKTLDKMFELHNMIFPDNKEHNKTCGACQKKVFEKLKTWWVDNR